jgi:hypothetical protein
MITWDPDAGALQDVLGDEEREAIRDFAGFTWLGILLLPVIFAWTALLPVAVHLGEVAGSWL